MLTKSGKTSESIYLAKLLKKRACKTWLISFSRKSPLHDMLANHLIIELEHEGDLWNVIPNNSTVINLIVLQELAMQIGSAQNISLEILLQNHPGGHICARLLGGDL